MNQTIQTVSKEELNIKYLIEGYIKVSKDGTFDIIQAQHSIYNGQQVKEACGLPIIPFRTKIDGPAKVNFQFANMDIIDEAFTYFRINVLFKNY